MPTKFAISFLFAAFCGLATARAQVVLPATAEDSLRGSTPAADTLRAEQLSEVIIRADRLSNLDSPGRLEIRKDVLQKTHGLLEDPMQTVARMPGVGRVGDLFTPSRLYVRGGDSDEILFMLDNTPITWPWYFGGQKSMFNTDVIKDIELLTGGFSAAYGNYMSSVLNVSMKEGSFRETHGSVSLGIYDAQGYLETPLVKDKLSLIVAVRSTYMDKILKNAGFPTPGLFDTNLKLAYRLNANNLITFTNALSYEKVDYTSSATGSDSLETILSKGRKNTQSLAWQSRFSDKTYNKFILTHNANDDEYALDLTDAIKTNSNTFGFRNDLSYFLTKSNQIKAGLEAYSTRFALSGFENLSINYTNPEQPSANRRTYDFAQNLNRMGAYLLYEGTVIGKLQANAGLRWDSNFEKTDLSPRLKLLYPVASNTSVHAAWGRYHQFAGLGTPDARSFASSYAAHYILGIKQRLGKAFSGWVEAYQKDYNRLRTPNPDGTYTGNGTGTSRGLELFLQKETGILQGWASYGLAKSTRTYGFDKQVYAAPFDQRHIINANVEWHIVTLGKSYLPALVQLTYRHETGRPYTPVVGALQDGNTWYPIRGDINSQRLGHYDNLNLRIEWRQPMKGTRVFRSYIETWNILNIKNPISTRIRYGDEYPNNVKQGFTYAYGRLIGGGLAYSF